VSSCSIAMVGAAAEAPAALPAWVEALAAGSDDPVAEMLALVWGPRFDHEHALALLARLPRSDSAWAHAIQAFAERFDRMPSSGQQALRRGILRDRSERAVFDARQFRKR